MIPGCLLFLSHPLISNANWGEKRAEDLGGGGGG